MNIHDHDRAARLRALMPRKRFLRRALKIEVDRQHDIVSRLGRVQNGFGLAVTKVVDQHGFLARASAQFRVKTALDADHAAIIRQPVIEIGIFAFHRTVIALQIAEQMRRRRAGRINARGLQIQIRAEAVGEMFLEPRDLRGVQVRQNRERQREPRLVGALKLFRIQRQRLAELLANLRDKTVGDVQTRLGLELLPLPGRKSKLFAFGFRERTAQFFLLRGDVLLLNVERLFAQRAVASSNCFRKSSR